MPIPLIIPALVGAAGKIATGIFQNSKANKIKPVYNYQKSPDVAKRMGLATGLLNSALPGMAGYQAGINSGMSTAVQNVNAASTNSGSALAGSLAAYNTMVGKQGDLRDKVVDWQKSAVANFNSATDAAAQQTAMENQAMLQKYQEDAQAKLATRDSAFGNIFGGITDAIGLAQVKDQLGSIGKPRAAAPMQLNLTGMTGAKTNPLIDQVGLAQALGTTPRQTLRRPNYRLGSLTPMPEQD